MTNGTNRTGPNVWHSLVPLQLNGPMCQTKQKSGTRSEETGATGGLPHHSCGTRGESESFLQDVGPRYKTGCCVLVVQGRLENVPNC